MAGRSGDPSTYLSRAICWQSVSNTLTTSIRKGSVFRLDLVDGSIYKNCSIVILAIIIPMKSLIRHRTISYTSAFFAVLILAANGLGQTTAVSSADDARVQRLAGLARVWGTVKFFHPYTATRDIDWDKALVDAIPRVNAAKTPAEYAQAVDGMLKALGDTATYAEMSSGNAVSDTAARAVPPDPLSMDGNVLVIDIVGAARTIALANDKQAELVRRANEMSTKAATVVLDMRGEVKPEEDASWFLDIFLKSVIPGLFDKPIQLASSRYRIHNGYPPQTGSTSGGYFSGMTTDTPEFIAGRRTASAVRVVVLMGETETEPRLVSGLQASGAFLVRDGQPKRAGGANPFLTKLPDNVVARMRTVELVGPTGGIGLEPDAVAAQGKALEVARRLISENSFESLRRSSNAATSVSLTGQRDKTYPEMEFPPTEYRLLALFRFWHVIDRFFPYKHLIDKPWDEVLTRYIPKFEQNKDAVDYQVTVQEMVAEIQDSHGGVRYPTQPAKVSERRGRHFPAISIRFVGDELMVNGLLDPSVPLKKGEVISAIEGQPVWTYGERSARLFAHSTRQSLKQILQFDMLRGQQDSVIRLTVKDLKGLTRDVELKRTVGAADPRWQQFFDGADTKLPVYRMLPSGYGYVDLVRLTVADVDKMFESLKNAPAIIFDMRGYPKGTAWAIAPRLTDKRKVAAARFYRPIWFGNSLSDGDFTHGTHFTFEQTIPDTPGETYKGKVVMLIDEKAISQSEHTALFFEAATDTTFVGSPTMGANGDVTTMTLPGNLTVSFSGHDVRHVDGRQLQRVGIQPHVKAVPTVKGILAGRDEVLEAAIAYLRAKGIKAARK